MERSRLEGSTPVVMVQNSCAYSMKVLLSPGIPYECTMPRKLDLGARASVPSSRSRLSQSLLRQALHDENMFQPLYWEAFPRMVAAYVRVSRVSAISAKTLWSNHREAGRLLPATPPPKSATTSTVA